MRDRLITARQPGERYVIEWPSYKALCEGDQVAAKLLEQFDYLTRCVMESEETDEPQPFSRSRPELYRDLSGSHGQQQIENSIAYLERRGFITVNAGSGQKRQFVLHFETVDAALRNLSQTRQVTEPVSNETATCLKRDSSDHLYIQTFKDEVSTTSQKSEPGEEDLESTLYLNGSAWAEKQAKSLGKTIKVNTSNTRNLLDAQLSGSLADAVARRRHVARVMEQQPGQDVTAKVKVVCAGYSNGKTYHQNNPPPGKSSPPPGSRGKSTRPGGLKSRDRAVELMDEIYAEMEKKYS